ncbi:MAG: AsmA-like C-terminal region-containing protein, partial [Caulobacterales bacterium]|nr:AsmA-like C-terminal region-containing protein [Caulobacterales bacterium]
LDMTEGFVDIPRLVPKGAVARFGATGRGAARDVIKLIDEPPLGFPTAYGLSPDDFAGEGVLKVELGRRMRRHVPAEDIGFEVEGRFTGVRALAPIGELEIADADVDVQADRAGMSIRAEGFLGPAPASITWSEDFTAEDAEPSTRMTLDARVDARVLDAFGVPSRDVLEGETDLQVEAVGSGMTLLKASVAADLAGADLRLPGADWRKPAGAPGSASFVVSQRPDGGMEIVDLIVEAEDVHIAGAASMSADGRLETARIYRLRFAGGTDLSGAIERDADGAVRVTVSGASFDARGILSELPMQGLEPSESEDLRAPVTVSARLERALVADDVTLRDLALRFDHTGDRLRTLTFEALGPTGWMRAEVGPDATSPAGARRVVASAPDAGLVLRVLFGLDTLEGGALAIGGTLPALDAPPGAPGELVMSMNDFRLRGAPTLAKILTLGSFRGLADTLSGEGIAFSRLEAPIMAAKGRFTLDEARVVGPALGVTVSGEVDLPRQELSLSGALAPAYTLNSLFGATPFVGDLLVSREGEGVFGLTYSVQGPFEETRVRVNPLSAFAPGRLRRLFEGSGELDDGPLAEGEGASGN